MVLRNRKSGYVALFDVLGFSERVVRNGLDGLDTYIDAVVALAGAKPEIGVILFSDTVVFFTSDDEETSFDAIIGTTSHLLHEFILRGIPARGAISYGDFVRSDHTEHGTVIVGRPIIEAHHYEAQLQAVGVMLAPSVVDRIDSLSKRASLKSAKGLPAAARLAAARKALQIQPWKTIPLEPTAGTITPYDGFAVAPIPSDAGTFDDLAGVFKKTRRRLERLKQIAPEARSQAKYQRTIDWLGEIRERFEDAQLHIATASDLRKRASKA